MNLRVRPEPLHICLLYKHVSKIAASPRSDRRQCELVDEHCSPRVIVSPYIRNGPVVFCSPPGLTHSTYAPAELCHGALYDAVMPTFQQGMRHTIG